MVNLGNVDGLNETFSRHRGKGTETLTVEGFTKVDDLVSLGHFL